MILYILIAVMIILIGVLFYREEKPRNGLIPLFLILVIVSGIRGEMSTDHPRYNMFFDYMAQLDWKNVFTNGFVMENGYAVLNKMVSSVYNSHVFFAFVVATLTMLFGFLAYGKRSKIPWLSVLLFFSIGEYFDSFNLIRQVLAISICFFATKYINDKKKDFLKYLVLVLLASTFHSTAAIIMIPAYFILKIRFSGKALAIYSGIGVLIFALFPKLLDLYIKLFPQYDLEQYGDYINTTNNMNSIIPIIGVFAFVMICYFFGQVDFDQDNYDNRVAMNGLTLLMVLAPLGLHMAMAQRLSLYFRPFVALTAVNIIANFKTSRNKKIIISAICVAAILFIIIVHRESPYNPYYVHDEIKGIFG